MKGKEESSTRRTNERQTGIFLWSTLAWAEKKKLWSYESAAEAPIIRDILKGFGSNAQCWEELCDSEEIENKRIRFYGNVVFSACHLHNDTLSSTSKSSIRLLTVIVEAAPSTSKSSIRFLTVIVEAAPINVNNIDIENIINIIDIINLIINIIKIIKVMNILILLIWSILLILKLRVYRPGHWNVRHVCGRLRKVIFNKSSW